MVAQPVDTIPPSAPASVRDSMSPGIAEPKETQRMDIMSDASIDLDLSEDSPPKEQPRGRDPAPRSSSRTIRTFTAPMETPRTSPSRIPSPTSRIHLLQG